MKRILLAGATLVLASVANASIIEYGTNLSAANEVPPTASLGTGVAIVIVDNIANTISLNVSFSGLTSNDTAAHIHCCMPLGVNAGVATVMPSFPGFPLGVTSGAFSGTFSLLDPLFYNPAFVTANGGTAATAEAALLTGIASGQTYFNIHTMNNGGGEIRGQLGVVPEPATLVLAGLGLAGLAAARRRRLLR